MRTAKIYKSVILMATIIALVLAGSNIALAGVKVKKDKAKTFDGRDSGYELRMIEISYGSGPDEVGAIDKGEGYLIGPNDYDVDNKGNIYVLDTLNTRVQVYSKAGAHLNSFPLGVPFSLNIAKNIVLDNAGNVYVLFSDFMFYQYDKNGNIQSELQLDAQRWGRAFSSIYVVGNKFYTRNSFYRTAENNKVPPYTMIAKLSGGKLTQPSEEDYDSIIKGIPGKNNNAYEYIEDSESKKKHKQGILSLRKKNNSTSKVLELKLPDKYPGGRKHYLLSDDFSGNIYTSAIRRMNGQTANVIDVFKFSPNGDYVDTFQLPELHGHYLGSSNSFKTDNKGDLYYFIAAEDALYLNIYSRN